MIELQGLRDKFILEGYIVYFLHHILSFDLIDNYSFPYF